MQGYLYVFFLIARAVTLYAAERRASAAPLAGVENELDVG
jgi:hypothetical protein